MEVISSDLVAEKAKASKFVIIDVFASWCGPCRMINPLLEVLEKEVEGLSIFKIDADENKEWCESESVTSLPTLKVYHNGELKETLVGARNRHELKRLLESFEG